jgi:glycosyltransferase involved in cell wall biosynthesis
MKLAVVCDDLIQFGGAEQLFLTVLETWPDTEVYTSVISPEWRRICAEKNIKVHTSFLQKFPFAALLNRYYSTFLLHVFAFESFDLSNFDVVLSMSARYAHYVVTKPPTTHICYMHSPGRMFWEPKAYFQDETYGALTLLKKLAHIVLSVPLSILRILDYTAAQRVDFFIANSKTTQARIKHYYKRDAVVIYPFVETKPSMSVAPSEAYFLVISRLVSWKKLDIAIEACNSLKLKLKIIGTGPDHGRLKKIAGSTITFLGRVPEEEKNRLLKNCLAVIQTQHEDFGLVPLEAMTYGKPTIAFGRGGALETIIDGETGLLFAEQTPKSLADCLQVFSNTNFNSAACVKHASTFTKARFVTSLRDFVYNVSQPS